MLVSTFNLIADGSSAALRRDVVSSQGSRGENVGVLAEGSFGTGAVTLEGSVDKTTWVQIGTLSLSADGIGHEIAKVPWVRITLTGATAPDVNVSIIQ